MVEFGDIIGDRKVKQLIGNRLSIPTHSNSDRLINQIQIDVLSRLLFPIRT